MIDCKYISARVTSVGLTTGITFRPSLLRRFAGAVLNECGQWNPDAIEAQLAHVEGNAVRRAYARAEFWDERVKMMQWWADRLDELKRRGEI